MNHLDGQDYLPDLGINAFLHEYPENLVEHADKILVHYQHNKSFLPIYTTILHYLAPLFNTLVSPSEQAVPIKDFVEFFKSQNFKIETKDEGQIKNVEYIFTKCDWTIKINIIQANPMLALISVQHKLFGSNGDWSTEKYFNFIKYILQHEEEIIKVNKLLNLKLLQEEANAN